MATSDMVYSVSSFFPISIAKNRFIEKRAYALTVQQMGEKPKREEGMDGERITAINEWEGRYNKFVNTYQKIALRNIPLKYIDVDPNIYEDYLKEKDLLWNPLCHIHEFDEYLDKYNFNIALASWPNCRADTLLKKTEIGCLFLIECLYKNKDGYDVMYVSARELFERYKNDGFYQVLHDTNLLFIDNYDDKEASRWTEYRTGIVEDILLKRLQNPHTPTIISLKNVETQEYRDFKQNNHIAQMRNQSVAKGAYLSNQEDKSYINTDKDKSQMLDLVQTSMNVIYFK